MTANSHLFYWKGTTEIDATIKRVANTIAIDHLPVYQMKIPPANGRRKIVLCVACLCNKLSGKLIWKSL